MLFALFYGALISMLKPDVPQGDPELPLARVFRRDTRLTKSAGLLPAFKRTTVEKR
jgi:hypothetical protein